MDEDPDYLQNIWFSDEATFFVSGEVNRHNFRYWAPENPNWHREAPLHSEKVNVWAAMSRFGIIGPYFFTGNVNWESYLMVLEEFESDLRSKFPALFQRAVFQQDGAPPHWKLEVRAWLNTHFPRWIGRDSAYARWPPRSPDLTPLDYFLWGYIKSKVYHSVTPVANLDELKRRITNAFHDLPNEIVMRAIDNYPIRLQACWLNEGHHIEILLKE
jgi:hypothetical protein